MVVGKADAVDGGGILLVLFSRWQRKDELSDQTLDSDAGPKQSAERA